MVGRVQYASLPPEVTVLHHNDRVPMFYRLFREDGQIFYSAKYLRMKKRNSYTISYTDEDNCLQFGQIQSFAVIGGSCMALIKLVNIHESAQTHFQLTFDSLDRSIFPVQYLDTIKAVPVKAIKEKCIFMDLGMELYIARFPSQFTPMD